VGVSPAVGKPTGSNGWFVGVLVVVLVFGGIVTRWATSSFDDWVPLVPPTSLPVGVDATELPVSAHFRCSAAFGSSPSATPTEQAHEALTVQRLYREPCTDARGQYRALAELDLVVAAAGLVVAAIIWVRRRPSRGAAIR